MPYGRYRRKWAKLQGALGIIGHVFAGEDALFSLSLRAFRRNERDSVIFPRWLLQNGNKIHGVRALDWVKAIDLTDHFYFKKTDYNMG